MHDRTLHGCTVLIAGAGLSGLTAAYELTRAGAKVIVCEARDRVGGRVWTIREGFLAGQHAEAGGDLIEDEHEAVCTLAHTLHLTLGPILRTGFSFARRTRRGVVREGHAEPVWTSVKKRLRPWLRAYALSEQRWDSAIAATLARMPAAQWLQERGATDRERALVTGLRGFFLADPQDLSLLALVDQLAAGTPGRMRMSRVIGGNDLIATRLAARLAEPVLMKTVVRAIRQNARGVRVTVESQDGSHAEIAADYAVVTLPATTLRHVAFDPPLPDAQQRAIAELPYGPVTKTLLQCDHAFWRKPRHPRAYGTDLPTGAVWDGNEGQRGKAGILVLMAGGGASLETRRLADKAGPQGLLRELQWLGAGETNVLNARAVTWEADPWSGGGYASFTVNYDATLRPWLARPHGRVLFAGEHTSLKWQGYMNGAVETGQRAASEVRALAGER